MRGKRAQRSTMSHVGDRLTRLAMGRWHVPSLGGALLYWAVTFSHATRTAQFFTRQSPRFSASSNTIRLCFVVHVSFNKLSITDYQTVALLKQYQVLSIATSPNSIHWLFVELHVLQNDPFSCANGGGADAFLSLCTTPNNQTTIMLCSIHYKRVVGELESLLVWVLCPFLTGKITWNFHFLMHKDGKLQQL